MSQEKNKRGYESEDGIGIVYDARLRSSTDCNNRLCIISIMMGLLLCIIVGFGAGFWFGENTIIKQFGLLQSSELGPPVEGINNDFDEISDEDEPLYDSPRGGIFPPPSLDVFSAGNGKPGAGGNGGLTMAEKRRIKEAVEKCRGKRCCREDDDINTDSSECTAKGYLQCLAADNACVWDCSLGYKDPNDLHYNRKFKGIDRHDSYGINRPNAKLEDDLINANKIDPDLIINTVDECGTLYEFKLKEEDRKKEEERIKNNPYSEQESNGGDDAAGNHRRLITIRKQVNFSKPGEMNETLLNRRLAVLGWDGRTSVTSWQWPYYKVVYITFQTNAGTFRCSGALITPKHVITAGHCISDGSGNFYWGWKVYPSYNAGSTTSFTTYQGWVFNNWHNNRDWNWDIGVLTLHSDNTGYGYFGFGWNNGITSSYNFGVVGYPSDKGTTMQRQNMYMDYAIYTNLLLTQTGDIIGGNSGGPAYYESNKIVYGVVSHMVGTTYNGHARITKSKFDSMCAYIRTFSATSTHC